ncbi:DUF4148 domain-containing protein [Paraburkholderia sp. BL21I4N1]|uniref:DUF4148 domain-containing protein n=1 Tax=Paraburkholderia sp. BL21I4N1 TaxID=1938801 RepID=UPI000D408CFE|nr:DUF4148 domain-containing protein [Paraburkholderia sp. BL21I4N1]PQV49252.1 uncharacterized protein DUF4148 [Paraburkholderia sp. BL21I4N1]
MNRSIRYHGPRVLTRLLAASVLTVAGVPLVQAQQPSADTQNNGTTTRAAKKAELKKLEKNGYQPSADDPHYPQDIQNAEKKANGGGNPTGPMPSANGQNSQ